MSRPWLRRTVAVGLTVLTATVAFALALLLTPPVRVTVFGQDLRLGAVSPVALRGLAGPGQADLFGEGPVETALQFDGPIRPRIEWQRFDRNAAASDFIETSPTTGPTLRTTQLGDALASGWTSYFVRLVLVTAVIAAGLRLALLGVGAIARGRLPHVHGRGRQLGQVAVTVGVAVLLVLVSVLVSITSARAALSSIRSLSDLTGTAPLVPPLTPAGALDGDVELAVIGDSTAAGVGNTPLAKPSGFDETCGRSRDAYAVVMGAALKVKTANLACSSATLDSGLLGPQQEGQVTVPPQVGVLKALPSLRVVVVSVGANDIGWADFLRLCYGLDRCDDQVSERLFENRLDTFRIQYAQLLQQLADLPTHPSVVVVQYYDPFGQSFDCPALVDPNRPPSPPAGYGFAGATSADQATKLRTKIDPMRSELTQLNEVLAEGAGAFGFATVAPSFAGHELCTAQPWVQGLSQRYPFHPDAAGELAIAAALLPQVASDLAAPRA
ncbi:MAG: hypothetical protein GC157_17265 [Frankiales bacterium]|nr:hypothetical protein [Frankiales bacterium]